MLLCLGLAALLPAKEANWTGNYTDKKYLNSQAVFQLNILQEGETISVDFDAVYNDGHDCAPQGSGPAKVVDKNSLIFTFTDSANNAGTGTIKRTGDGVVLSIKPTHIGDPRCVVFYKENIRLGTCALKRRIYSLTAAAARFSFSLAARICGKQDVPDVVPGLRAPIALTAMAYKIAIESIFLIALGDGIWEPWPIHPKKS